MCSTTLCTTWPKLLLCLRWALFIRYVGFGHLNALVEVHGPELPIMDGSASGFVFALLAAGIAEQDEMRPYYLVGPLLLDLGQDLPQLLRRTQVLSSIVLSIFLIL